MNVEKLGKNLYLLIAKGMMVIAVFALTIMAVPTKTQDGVKPPAEFFVTLDWPTDQGDIDLDLWIKDPFGDIVWFNKKESQHTTLDRDVTGDVNNEIIGAGGVKSRLNSEFATIRSLMEGEYVVNVVYYGDHHTGDGQIVPPVPFEVKLVKMNPHIQPLADIKGSVNRIKWDAFVMRFTVNKDGTVDVDTQRPVYLQRAGGNQ